MKNYVKTSNLSTVLKGKLLYVYLTLGKILLKKVVHSQAVLKLFYPQFFVIIILASCLLWIIQLKFILQGITSFDILTSVGRYAKHIASEYIFCCLLPVKAF